MQIKCGLSFFKEQNDEGYIFRAPVATVNYWLNLSLPVIVCLCNPVSNDIFWCHITTETVKRLPKGYKILVPFSNMLNIDNKYKIGRIFDSVVQIEEIVDAALFKYLYERYKSSISICPLMEEPRDFHSLSYIAQINKELYIIGTIIDKYGYLDGADLLEKVRLYHENRLSMGWEQFGTKSKLLVAFISEAKDNLVLNNDIVNILTDNSNDVEYCRLHLSKQFIMLTLLDDDDNGVYFFDEKGQID